jgi:hypothetical protein
MCPRGAAGEPEHVQAATGAKPNDNKTEAASLPPPPDGNRSRMVNVMFSEIGRGRLSGARARAGGLGPGFQKGIIHGVYRLTSGVM